MPDKGRKKDLFPIQKFEIIFLESLAEHFFGGWQFMICWNECICSGADFLHDFEIPVDPHAHRSGVIMIDTVVRTKNDPLFELIINEKNLFKNLFSVDKRRTWRGIDKHGSTTAGMIVSAAFCTEKFSVKCDAFVTPGPAHMSQSKTESFHMHQTFKLHGTVEIRGNLSIPEGPAVKENWKVVLCNSFISFNAVARIIFAAENLKTLDAAFCRIFNLVTGIFLCGINPEKRMIAFKAVTECKNVLYSVMIVRILCRIKGFWRKTEDIASQRTCFSGFVVKNSCGIGFAVKAMNVIVVKSQHD